MNPEKRLSKDTLTGILKRLDEKRAETGKDPIYARYMDRIDILFKEYQVKYEALLDELHERTEVLRSEIEALSDDEKKLLHGYFDAAVDYFFESPEEEEK